jgi:iron complex transport system substrate-binding protein
MAAGSPHVIGSARILAALLLAAAFGAGAVSPAVGQSARAATRIVSLVPAVTEMLFAIGASSQVVAVSSFDRYPPTVEKLPRVGALLDPDTERILSLKPGLVVVYGSQTDLMAQFKQAGIRAFAYRHGGLAETFETMTAIGAETGHSAEAAKVVGDLRARLDGIRRRVAGRPRPRTLLVISREPGTLRGIYASGGVGFLHDLLDLAGGANVFADVRQESVQPSQETLLQIRPDVIVELHPTASEVDQETVHRLWRPLSSIPAVQNQRIHALPGAAMVIAGPRLGDAAELLSRAIHRGL